MKMTKTEFERTYSNQTNPTLVDSLNQLSHLIFSTPSNKEIENIKASIAQLEQKGFSTEQIVSILIGVDYNDQDLIINSNAKKEQILFCTRLQTISKYIIQCKNSHPGCYIQSSASDPHKNGKHTLFMTYSNKTKWAFKDRSLHVDNAFVGKNGIIAYLNGFITEKKNQLPILNIFPEDKMEEFVIKENELNKESGKLFFKKLGMLECISQLIGATDLHHDNIMPTKNGPLVIDAECAFFGFGAETYINYVLQYDTVHHNMDKALSYFEIETQPALEVLEDETITTSFNEGKLSMISILKNKIKEPEFKKDLPPIISRINKIRIVPWATADLAVKLDLFYTKEYKINDFKESDIMKPLIEKVRTFFSNGVKFQNQILAENDYIANIVFQAFSEGTIPVWEIEIPVQGDKSTILLNDNIVGTIKFGHQTIVDYIVDARKKL